MLRDHSVLKKNWREFCLSDRFRHDMRSAVADQLVDGRLGRTDARTSTHTHTQTHTLNTHSLTHPLGGRSHWFPRESRTGAKLFFKQELL